MRTHFLTERERAMLNRYITSGETTDETFRMLKKRIKENFGKLEKDFELVKQAKEKFEPSTA